MPRAWFATAALLCGLAASPASPQPAKPMLDLVLRPNAEGDAIDVSIKLGRPGLAKDGVVATLPKTVVSMPGIPLDGRDIRAIDAAGPLAITARDLPPDAGGQIREFHVARPTQGDVTLRYRAHVRAVDATTRMGPIFDLRAQPGGVNGAGATFLALPPGERRYRTRLHWDMAATPGWRGVSTQGDGDVSRPATPEELRYAFYYAGRLQTHRQGLFALYWTTTPPFDAAALGQSIGAFYDTITGFVGAPHAPYRVFVRENPFRGSGGTAFGMSFVTAYDAARPLPFGKLQALVAHEMTHSWFTIAGSHAETAWYTEGTAEYYSMLLLLRAKRISIDEFAERLTARALSYWANPLSSLDNAAAAERFWSDNAAQVVPYGRGLLYFVNTNARIRAASVGRRSLDDPIRAFIAMQRAGRAPGVAEWLALVRAEIGATADADFRALAAGGPMRPLDGAFAPCLRLVPATVLPFDLGFDQASLAKGVIAGVRADGPAGNAGLRDGDRVIDATSVYQTLSDTGAHMQITVDRAGTTRKIDYLPRGTRPIAVRRWERDPAVDVARCAL